MRRPHLLALPAALLVLPLVSACSTGAADDGKPQVVASFYPLQFVAQEIVGEHADVTNLTSPGAEPHDLQLTPRQVALVSKASVALYEEGLQPAVDQAVENDPPKNVVDVNKVVTLSAVPPGLGDETAKDSNGKAADPHFWLDPTQLAKVADAFATTIAKADPKHASDYAANNTKLQADLAALDSETRSGLASCVTRTLVVSHDAWEYYGRRYDLKVYPIAGISPDAEPSAKHLQELSDLIRTDKITTVFSERLASPKLADALASDGGIKTEVLDPIEGLDKSDPDATYLSLMRDNLKAIQQANSCT